MALIITGGSTRPENWENYNPGENIFKYRTIFVHVDIKYLKLASAPIIVVTLAGVKDHFAMEGITVYNKTATSFDVFARLNLGVNLNYFNPVPSLFPTFPFSQTGGLQEVARELGWYIDWHLLGDDGTKGAAKII
jgi:hypothetical protein